MVQYQCEGGAAGSGRQRFPIPQTHRKIALFQAAEQPVKQITSSRSRPVIIRMSQYGLIAHHTQLLAAQEAALFASTPPPGSGPLSSGTTAREGIMARL